MLHPEGAKDVWQKEKRTTSGKSWWHAS